MRALSIRQPYAELILRGIKRIEYRSKPTKIVGERFWIYASKNKLPVTVAQARVWSNDLSTELPPPWIAELANHLELFDEELPTGVIVGSAVIEKVVPFRRSPLINHRPPFEWHLISIERARTLRKPTGHPQPVWFNPF